MVQLTQTQPPYGHIKLESIRVRPYLKFIDELYEYEQKYGIELPVPTLLSKAVREELIARNPRQFGAAPEFFYSLTKKEVLKLLQRAIRPTGRSAFTTELEANIRFPQLPPGYTPEASKFKFFYDALLAYRLRFVRVYQILADDNKKKNIPKCDTKEGGLIKTFLQNIPFRYGSKLHQELPAKKYKHIESYLEKFFDEVQRDFNTFSKTRRTNEHFGGTEVEAAAKGTPWSRSANHHGNSQHSRSSGPGSNNRPQGNIRSIDNGRRGPSGAYRTFPSSVSNRLHAIGNTNREENDYPEYFDVVEEVTSSQDDQRDDDDLHATWEEEAAEDREDGRPSAWPEDLREELAEVPTLSDQQDWANTDGSEQTEDTNELLHQIMGQTKYDNRTGTRNLSLPPTDAVYHRQRHGSSAASSVATQKPCMFMLLGGSCGYGDNCKYSHNPSLLRTAHKSFVTRLEKSPYKADTTPTGKVQVLQANQKQRAVPPGLAERSSLSHIHVVGEGSAVRFSLAAHPEVVACDDVVSDQDVLHRSIQQVMLRDKPESAIIRAVYCSGQARLPASSIPMAQHQQQVVWTADIEHVLFDTGAVSGSYISQRFVNQHLAVLRPHLCSIAGEVNLAVEGAKVQIKHTLLLHVSFTDRQGRLHSGDVRFTVLPTLPDTDMIIGLPEILTSFYSLHISMLDNAVDNLASLPQEQLVAGLQHIEDTVEQGPPADSPPADSPHVESTPAELPPAEPPPAFLSSVAATSPTVFDIVKDTPGDSLMYPWKVTVEREAPEDADTDLPCSFPYALHFLEMSHEEAINEFFSLFDKHVDKAFAETTPILELLRTKGSMVFVPSNWEGINGLEPLQLDWRPGLPESMKPKPRPVNPKLYAAAKKEFQRLLGYFYVPSTSPIASCLVIAPKATHPFIRFCGDYVAINRFINIGHFPIPHVQRALEKIVRFRYFLDFDLVNAFHQIVLAAETAARLSVQTPWGQVQPKFMPEGIGPASGHLQKVISSIFADFEEFTIVIFDNLLVLATDYEDAYRKTELILDRCIQRNVYLKFSKTWLGFDHANFFGYVCRHGSYELSEERKAAIQAMVFPKTMKQMQSFLGSANFFSSFVPHFSTLAAPLHDMVKKTFNWADKSTWTCDYERVFEVFKKSLQQACALVYPDYSLKWILRADASLWGVGAVLLQCYPPPEDAPPSTPSVLKPIAFASAKFSPQATRWTTIEQESYAIFFAVFSFRYYLTCKDFILETDHANLLWMEASAVPKIIRWRVYLQSFSFLIRHIPGKSNVLADWLSRMYAPVAPAPALISGDTPALHGLSNGEMQTDRHGKKGDNNLKHHRPYPSSTLRNNTAAHLLPHSDPSPVADTQPRLAPPIAVPNAADLVPQDVPPDDLPLPTPNQYSYLDVLHQVHGGRMGHHGTRRTWLALNDLFPGHRIPYRLVDEFVSTCPICQKLRLGLVDTIEPVVKTLHPEHHRSMVGSDTLTITPRDKNGNKYLVVIVNHMTKFAYLYALATHEAILVAQCLFHYFCTFGLSDALISDPGSEFDNEVVAHLSKWFGIRHKFSLVDRHESNGVEGTNKLILRHLSLLVHDERIVSNWSSPSVLPLIQFFINSMKSSESGIVPLHAHFGSDDATYMRLPDHLPDDSARVHAYVRELDENLRLVRAVAKETHTRVSQLRTKDTPVERQNMYQPGDLVLFEEYPSTGLRPDKLTPRFTGPFYVQHQKGNDVSCKHVGLGVVRTFHVTRLKIFHGSVEEARKVAMLDGNQHTVDCIIGFKGDPHTRTTMSFLVRFRDGDELWLPWSRDISDTIAFEDFCRNVPGLQLLIYDVKEADNRRKQMAVQIPERFQPTMTVLIDLRTYGYSWYDSALSSVLPALHTTTYLVPHTLGRLYRHGSNHRKKIDLHCALFNETYKVTGDYLELYGLTHPLPVSPLKQVVIDEDFVSAHKEILPNATL